MPKPNKYDRAHLRNLRRYQKQIDAIYAAAIQEAAAIGGLVQNIDPDRIFSFADYPITHDRVRKLLGTLASEMEMCIVNGVRSEWTLANNKNNALCDRVFGENKLSLPYEAQRRYYATNDTALEAFLSRQTDGLNLSDRVWRYTDAFKQEIELGLDLGIRSGQDARSMAKDLKTFLRFPDKLFRRVRDEHGELQLSKAAAAFHPGRGVYRSSYKNALRLAATETNIAYRTADHERWGQLDFVVGQEVRCSDTNHPVADICDFLAGKYPKDFKFVGWHPFCRCYVIPVLKTEQEMDADCQRILRGEEPLPPEDSENVVGNVPEAFTQWVDENAERTARARQLPYFIKDNPQYIDQLPEEWGLRPKDFRTNREWRNYVKSDEATFTPEQIANFREVESALSCQRGASMDFEDADQNRPNPRYNEGTTEYTENCQCSCVAYEMRRRGFNVSAVPWTETSVDDVVHQMMYEGKERWQTLTIPQRLSSPSERGLAYIDPKTGTHPIGKIATGASRHEVEKELNNLTNQPGRYQISLRYESGRGGHRITAERTSNGELFFYDAQSGEVIKEESSKVTLALFSTLYEFDSKAGIHVMRVDNKLINPDIIDGIVRVKRTRRSKSK